MAIQRNSEGEEMSSERIIRLPEVKSTVGLSTTTIYRLIKAGEFPAQIKLGQHASGWRESEVQAWIRARAGQSANDDEKQVA